MPTLFESSEKGSSHQKKVQFNQSAKKVFTNDSIGTCSFGLKLPVRPFETSDAASCGSIWYFDILHMQGTDPEWVSSGGVIFNAYLDRLVFVQGNC